MSLGMFLLQIKILNFLVLAHVAVSRLGPVKSDGVRKKGRAMKHTWKLRTVKGSARSRSNWGYIAFFLPFSKHLKALRPSNDNQNLTGSVCL